MALSFAEQIKALELATTKKLADLVAASSLDIVTSAQTPQPSVKQTGGSFEQGKIPVDTGFLRNSLLVGIQGKGQYFGADALQQAAGDLGPDDVLEAVWTAEYAPYIEYGTRNKDGTQRIAPRRFLGYHVERWRAIVDGHAQRLANR